MTSAYDSDIWGAAALVAEIDREIADRSAADKALVGKGRLDSREAEWRAAVTADLRDDLRFAFTPLPEGEPLAWAHRDEPRVPWRDKIRWIERELADRRAQYPGLVAKGRLTDADAAARIRAVAALRRLYWDAMFMWECPEGPGRDYLAALANAARAGGRVVEPLRRSEGAKVYRNHVRAHLAAVDAEQGQAQGELAA